MLILAKNISINVMSKIMILAIGGAGCNMAETIMREASVYWVNEASYLFADSDHSRLAGLKNKGYQTIDLNDTEISNEDFKGVEKLYILAGLGGKTGSGHMTDAVNTARSAGVQDISAIVTIPFYFKGDNKVAKAKETIGKLNSIPTKVLRNDDLLKLYADINFATAFHYSDMAALKAIESSEI